MKAGGVQILGIQEHRIIHSSEIEYQNLGNSTLITASAWRNDIDKAVGGVGLVVENTTALNSLTSVYKHNRRIVVANFAGNPATTVIATYSPTEGASILDKENYYDELSAAISQIPAHNVLLIVGDLNAHVSPNGKWDSLHQGKANGNGKLLEDLLLEHKLEITNIRFQKRRGKLWTYVSDMNRSKTQIDFIIGRKKWKNSIKNSEAYGSFSSIKSDHRVVIARVKLSLRVSKTKRKPPAPDWELLKTDKNLQEKYAVEVNNRFSMLEQEDHTATERYQCFIEANEAASKLLLPKKEKKKGTKISLDPRIEAVRLELQDSSKRYHANTTEINRLSVQECGQKLGDTYKAIQEEILNGQIKELEEMSQQGRHAKSWSVINKITGKVPSFTGKIKGNSPKDRVQRWQNHFATLLGSPPIVENPEEEIDPIHPPLDIDTRPFTLQEYKAAKDDIKEGKSCGDDNIAPEALKNCDLDHIILDFCNNALLNGEKPDQWSVSNIIPIPKKGDLSDPQNYRGISLSSLVAKTLNKMVLNRIKPEVEKILRREQNGFRPSRNTTQHILALRRIIEGVKSRNMPAVLTFIDFKKAFDSVHRGKMFRILAAYGIPEQIISLIELMYSKTMAKVISPDGETELFEILAGVLQGDTLAPYLFAIVIDYCMLRAINGDEERLGFTIERRRSRRIGPKTVTDVDFADDIALLAESIENARELLHRVEKSAASVGLHINASKTKVMTFNLEDDSNTIQSITGEAISTVDDFVYLGSWIENTDRDVKIRKAKAWAAIHRLKSIWKSDLSKRLKIRLFLAACESVLLYGAESWTLTQGQEKSLDGTYTKMLRMVLGVSWADKMSNEILYGSLPKLSDKIRSRRLKLAGHCIRHPELIANDLVLWKPEVVCGTARQGRPKETYVSMLLRDAGQNNKEELRTLMGNRDRWKKLSDLDRASSPTS